MRCERMYVNAKCTPPIGLRAHHADNRGCCWSVRLQRICRSQCADNLRNNWGPEKEYNVCKADLRGQVLGYEEDNVYFINCSIHLAQWIFIVPSIFLSSFCSETFNNWIYILMSTLILRGWKNMSAKWFDWLALIHDFLRNNGAFETAFLSV